MSTHGIDQKKYTLESPKIGRVRDEKQLLGYNVHYLCDGYPKSPDFTTTQCMYVTQLQLYS